MIVRDFILWFENAPAGARADGARVLARAWLDGRLDEAGRVEAEQVFFSLLDDPSPLARQALAETFAGAAKAPPALIAALACDQTNVSALVLARSPLLSDAQLIDCAAIGDSCAQAAIALRATLSPAVSAALAEIAAREALVVLAVNEGANLPEFAMRRMIERFWNDGELREALLGRAWLPATVRAALVAATARQLTDLAVERNWMERARGERIAQDSRDRAAMIIAAGCADYSNEIAALAAYLRVSGQLTAGLALRALLCGQTGLFEATLSELTGMGPRRIAGLVADPASSGFAAVYARAGMPESLFRAFQFALTALARLPHEKTEDGALRLPVIQAVLRQCEVSGDENLSSLVALLRRFEADATREAGRRVIERRKSETAPAPRPVQQPVAPALAAPILAAPILAPASAASETAPPVVAGPPVAEPAPAPTVETAKSSVEISIDLGALEKELIAA
ncbi:MAG: DUF2336 domain-containing protein [Rhodoblastus sp.]|uniref:DUF2336 domain-containing protein n=1 Tax=Rhodoblastus sp. TaxID=1962975 RepID=UPI003F9DC3F5